MALAIKLRVGDAALIGEKARRWKMIRVVEYDRVLELEGPEGQLRRISSDESIELEPDVMVAVGMRNDGVRVIFNAPPSITIKRVPREEAESEGR